MTNNYKHNYINGRCIKCGMHEPIIDGYLTSLIDGYLTSFNIPRFRFNMNNFTPFNSIFIKVDGCLVSDEEYNIRDILE
jgi:hypothetical protein